MKLVYLCGPIADCSDEECKNWRNSIIDNYSYCLNPMLRDYRDISLGREREIVELDKKDIKNCDILLFNYFKPSAGSSMELFYAFNIKKTTITINTNNLNLSPWIIYHSNYIVNSLEESLNIIKKL